MSFLHKSMTFTFLALSIFISGLSADLVSAQSSGTESMITLTAEEQAWLAEHPDITFGFTDSFEPFLIRGVRGQHTGILVDLLKELNSQLGTQFKLEVDSWSVILEKVKQKEMGAVLGVAQRTADAFGLLKTLPYYTVYPAFFAREDAPFAIKGLDDLRGKSVAILDNAKVMESILEPYGSDIDISRYPDNRTPLQMVFEGKVDLAFGLSIHSYYINKYGLLGLKPVHTLLDRPSKVGMAVRTDWPEFVSILNKFIMAIQKDELPRIMNKWFVDWPERPKAPSVQLTPEERAWLAEGHRVRVRISNLPPFGFIEPELRGLTVDYMKAAAEITGVDFRFVPARESWTKGFEDIGGERRYYDLEPAARHTPERLERYAMTDAYLIEPWVIYTRNDVTDIQSMADLAGRRVAVERGYVIDQKLTADYPEFQLVHRETGQEAIEAVATGEADAYIGGLIIPPYIIGQMGYGNLRVIAQTPYDPQGLAVAVRKDWAPLASMINKALKILRSERHGELWNKWVPSVPGTLAISVPDTERLQLGLNAKERAWLDQNHTVRVRVADWPPYLIVKDDQSPQGIVIEYLKLIGERTGIEFKYEVTNQPFAEFLESMKQGQGPDMTAVIVPTPEREKYLSFSETYIASPYVIFTQEQDNPILDISGLTGKTLAVPRGFVVQEQLDKDYPEIRQALYESDEAALQAVATGQADAYIGNLTVASHIIHGRGFSHLRVAAASPFGDQALSIGNRNDWPELTSIINKALASITEEEKTAIRNKYLAIKFEQGINKAEVLKWALIVGGSTLSIVLLFLFWNRQMSREISKRKKTELALKQAKDYAETAQVAAETANQAKSLFLANMSHELRTPLNAILGFSRMLAREQNATPDQQEKLAIINRSGQHLLSMINDVLDLSKIEAERIELQEHSFDLVALIKEISLMIQSRAVEKGLSVIVEAESISVPYVKTDMGKLHQILINLLNNAVKFTDQGGVNIRYDIEPIPQEPKRCHLVIEVEDTGLGIEPARQAQIFEPFVQGIDAPVRKGTGLGLSICKKYAEFMGGSIELESEVGKGSLFRVRLPAEIVEEVDIKTSVEDKPRVIDLAATQKTWRILIADDNRENLLLLKSLLEEVGFVVLEAKNGQEAVAVFKEESPDLIWMDMRMPVLDGYEAVRQIRQCTGGDTVPIIAITASAFSEQRQEILAVGCDDMVIKPFQAHEIFEAMGRLLDIDYIYEPKSEAAPIRVRAVELTAAMLADLPDELLQELRQATIALNREDALEVIARIADPAPEVATGLKELVDNYQMVELRDLLEEVKEKNGVLE